MDTDTNIKIKPKRIKCTNMIQWEGKTTSIMQTKVRQVPPSPQKE